MTLRKKFESAMWPVFLVAVLATIVELHFDVENSYAVGTMVGAILVEFGLWYLCTHCCERCGSWIGRHQATVMSQPGDWAAGLTHKVCPNNAK